MTAPVTFPLGPPTYSGNTLTVDTALQQPTRVTRRIADITLQRFITSAIFATGAGVTGGAVVYDQSTLNDLYLDRDVERVGPGDEFPLVTSTRQAPQVALVEKWGGKFYITDEARDRNDITHFNNQTTKLANTIVRKVNTLAVATLEAAIAGLGGAGTFVGNNWSAVVTSGTSQSVAGLWPAADFAKAAMLADVEELGIVYDLWLLNPQEAMRLAVIYGPSLADVLASNGITTYVSNRIAAGTGYAVARGQVGELRVEKPLGTETWREGRVESTWVQSSVRPVMYVTDPFAVKKITGLAG
jgi:hypothetical protein